MPRRWGISCNDILACLDVLSDVESEHEVDIEDSLSRDESDPQSEEVSDSYSDTCYGQLFCPTSGALDCVLQLVV